MAYVISDGGAYRLGLVYCSGMAYTYQYTCKNLMLSPMKAFKN